jgi:PleD family two-component response regulator
VSDLGIVHEGSPSGRLTVSVGIGYCGSPLDVSEPILFEYADRALYMAKGQGRNCVVLQVVRQKQAVA